MRSLSASGAGHVDWPGSGRSDAALGGGRSRYLSANALARWTGWGTWPVTLVALPLALAPSEAGATAIIDTACQLLNPNTCTATAKLTGQPDVSFQGGVLTMDKSTTYAQTPLSLSNSTGNTINQNGKGNTFSGVFTNATGQTGNITVTNVDPATGNQLSAGSVTFSATNTYTGTTTVNPGATLKLGTTGSIATSSGLVDNGTFSTGASTSLTTLSGSGAVSVTGGATTILTLSNASGLFSGVISGAGGLTIGAGTETLTGTNTYTGPTSVVGGATLALQGPGSIGGSSKVDVGTGGVFNVSAASGDSSIKALTGAAGSSVMVGGHTLILTSAGTSTFSGTISGAGGGLTVQKGTETLDTGSQSYTGLTTVSPNGGNATLKLTGSSNISASSGVLVDNNGANTGTFDISGFTPAGTSTIIKTLAGSGKVALGTNELHLSNASGIFTGNFTGTGKLTIDAGTETLMGTSTTKFTTTVSPSATLLGIGSLAGPLINNGTVKPIDPTTGDPGVFHSGAYTQAGKLQVAIDGTPGSGKYSQLAVTGKATLGGTLDVVDGSAIPLGNSTYDDVMTFTSRTGDFAHFEFNGTTCDGGSDVWTCGFGLTFTETFDTNSLDLAVTRVATPEPGTVGLLASGLLGLMAWRRRRT